MLRSFILLSLCYRGWAFRSPCTDDSHCDINYYCETSAYQCLDCLRCEDFRRAAPPISTECVKSVVECGQCTGGDKNGEGRDSIECINYVDKPALKNSDIQLPVYAWVLIILIIVTVVIAVVLLLQTNIVNKMTTYSLVCRAGRQRSASGELAASAPEPPPTYQAVCEEESSTLLLDTVKLEHESAMFVKPLVNTPPEKNRESADRQAAVPYNCPAYVRTAPMPLSNLPPSNNAASASGISVSHGNGAVAADGPIGADVSVVDGISGVADVASLQHIKTRNDTTDITTGNDSGHSGSSNVCSEPNGSQFIVVNNIVNVQTASISETSCNS